MKEYCLILIATFMFTTAVSAQEVEITIPGSSPEPGAVFAGARTAFEFTLNCKSELNKVGWGWDESYPNAWYDLNNSRHMFVLDVPPEAQQFRILVEGCGEDKIQFAQ